ncbi:O-antigen polymerase [Betaproteobacteria bacterium]|nr:O-antigen polymerase [Betaproteobacteria bacterium]GHU22926.1 O-antigen polymerase [Betaproteobacteria bacterium]GHU27477.1 O-antigen polymerase [Betaproteobacteria bacterium]
MRDLLVMGIIVSTALMALRRPWIGVMLWTWISLMNPHRYCYGFAFSAPVAAIAAGSVLLGLMMTKERENPFKGKPVSWMLAFALWMTVSWAMGYGMQSSDPVILSRDYDLWNRVIKIFFMLLVTLALLHKRFHIIAFAWVTAMSLAIIGAKGGIFTIAHGGSYHVYGPPGSMVEDNNDFALALVMLIPLLHFLQLQLKQGWGRHVMSILMLLCATSALGSQSRGGMLALSAMGVVMWWRSPRKGSTAIALLAVLVLILPMMPDAWWERMNTIQSYEEDGSAMGRIRAWKVATEVALHHIFGAGMYFQHEIIFWLWDVGQGHVLAAHSIYFQILGNHGFIGLFLYLMIGVYTFRSAGWLRKHAQGIPQAQWVAHLGSMMQVSMVGFAVGGAFLSMAYYDLQFNFMVMVVLARRWVETKGWEFEPAMGFLEYCGWRSKKKRPHADPEQTATLAKAGS